MKSILLSITLIISAALCYTSHAQTAPYKLQVGDFSELKVADGINVIYQCSNDSAGWVFFECEKQMASNLIFSNEKNKLKIEITPETQAMKNLPTITAYSMTLVSAENSGDSTLLIARQIPVNEFKATLVGNGSLIVNDVKATKTVGTIRTGNGQLVISGTTRQASLKNIGTGTIEASGLKAENVKCNILGTGPIDCNASASLSISGAGTGKVYYGGTPTQIKNHGINIKAIGIDNNTEVN